MQREEKCSTVVQRGNLLCKNGQIVITMLNPFNVRVRLSTESCLENNSHLPGQKINLPFMESEGSLLCSHDPAIRLYPEPVDFTKIYFNIISLPMPKTSKLSLLFKSPN
jgi:hypothetical protein